MSASGRDGDWILDQSRLDGVVDEIARITGRNVTLDDVYSKVLAYNTSHPTTDRARIESVLMKSVSADARTWETVWDLSTQSRPFILPANEEMGLLARVCVPLICRGLRVGYLWILVRDGADAPEPILEAVHGLRGRIEEYAYTVIEAIEPQTQDSAGREKMLMSFLRGSAAELPAERITSPLSDSPLRVLVVSSRSLRAAKHLAFPERIRLVRQAMGDALRVVHARILWAPTGDHAAALIGTAVTGLDLANIRRRFAESLALHGLTEEAGLLRLLSEAGISGPADAMELLPERYQEAIATLQACTVDARLAELPEYDAIGIYQFLSQAGHAWLPRSSKINSILQAPNGEELLAMLERIYDSNKPRNDLAAELHIHRTSLYHRLRRIGKIIGADPLDSFVRLDLHMALKARRWSSRPLFKATEEHQPERD